KDAAKKGPKFDAILLDVDDGPTSLIQPQNIQLYGNDGLEVIKRALTPGGRLAIWAAVGEPKLLNALGRAGFRTEEVACAKHARAKRQNHRIYLAEMRS
ncbi:MAG: spermidine synthase, partial [Pseudoalteromonas tetraodonis]